MPENEQNQWKKSHCASKQQNMTKMRSNSLKIAIEFLKVQIGLK